jgi:hypothetical protein
MQNLRCHWRLLTPALCLSALVACRNSDANVSSGVEIVKLVPSALAANGCSGPDQVFTPPQPVVPVGGLSMGLIGPMSQVAAAGDSETLFVSADNARVVAIDVSAMTPVEIELVAPLEVANLLGTVGITTPPVLSGLCVLDAATLLVAELTSNTILAVDRLGTNPVAFFAGFPDEAPGFADGPAAPGPGGARFGFDRPAQLLATAQPVPIVFVADPGNHAIRRVEGGLVTTVAGTGSPFFGDGDLVMEPVGFDTPTGLTVTCGGVLLVSETGASAAGGQRLRQLSLGPFSFLGQQGNVITRAGDGTGATLQGQGELASLAAPVSPLATSGQDVYWIDSTTGILRRMSDPADTVDCPLWSDCATAVSGGGNFTPMGVHSLTQTPAGLLFVLDAAAGMLFRITP